jgi:hypothetical protein
LTNAGDLQASLDAYSNRFVDLGRSTVLVPAPWLRTAGVSSALGIEADRNL